MVVVAVVSMTVKLTDRRRRRRRRRREILYSVLLARTVGKIVRMRTYARCSIASSKDERLNLQ